jgi:hypothetical protein
MLAAAVVGAVAVFGLGLLLLVQFWDSDSPDLTGSSEAPRSPRMTLEGVIALVSREHAGCPEQPALTLTAEAVYNGDGTWTVKYRDYGWTVDEEAQSVRPIGDPLPCPRR